MMAGDGRDSSIEEFLPLDGGLSNRVAQRLGLNVPTTRRALRAVLLVLITWLPIVLLAILLKPDEGIAVTLWRDPEFHSRYLLAVPLLNFAEVFMLAMLARQVRHFVQTGLISTDDRETFNQLLGRLRGWYDSTLTELLLAVVALGTAAWTRWANLPTVTSWERHHGQLTAAGWWHVLVSLPILYFFLLKFLWVLGLWTVFLVRVSRLNLQLTPTHPDRAGGLGFLGPGLLAYAPSVMACSIVASAGFAYDIYHRGESLATLKYHLMIYLAVWIVVVHLPLLALAPRLWRTRQQGLLEYGVLIQRHDRQFEDKWISSSGKTPSPLGSADLLTMAAVSEPFDHIRQMRCLPVDRIAVRSLLLATLIPLLPLIGTEIPFSEIVQKLTGFLL